MKELTKLQNLVFRVGAVMFVAGLAMHVFKSISFVGMILFVVGAVAFASMQLLCQYEGNDIVIARLRRQQIFSDVMFIVSAFLMLSQDLNIGPMWLLRIKNLWSMTLFIGGAIQLYTSFRIPSELEKRKKTGNFKSLVGIMLFSPLLVNTSCATQYNVDGTTSLDYLEGKTLYLKVFSEDSMKTVDSCRVQHGRLNFIGTLDSVQMVNIFMGDESLMPMVLEEGLISVVINDMSQSVSGTPLNDSLYQFINKKIKLDNELSNLSRKETRMILDGVPEYERASVLMNESVRIADENDKLLTTFITNNSDNVLGPGVFMIMTSSYPFPQLTPQIDEILFRAKPYFKNHPYVKKYLEAAQQNMEKIHTGEK